MNTEKETLLNLFRGFEGKTVEILEQEVDFPFTVLLKTLNELVEQRYLFMKDDTYYKIDNEHYYVGEVVINRKNGMHVLLDEQPVTISETNHLYLYPEDEVVYKVYCHTAEVVCILKHQLVYLVGSVHFWHRQIFFDSFKDVHTKFRITNANKFNLKNGTIVRCYISNYHHQELKIEKVLGDQDSDAVLLDGILNSYDLTKTFTKKVMSEVEQLPKNVEIKNYPDHQDFRNDFTVTIDGDSAKDFDDAISVKEIDGGYILKVHIADVSSYVKEGGEIDKEALSRSTSVYYPNGVIPMLPFELSDYLCSLMPNQDRLTLSCCMSYDKKGNLKDYWLTPSVINSDYRLTYSYVNRVLNEADDVRDPRLRNLIFTAQKLSHLLEQQHKKKGYIEFASDEVDVLMEKDKVIDIVLHQSGEAEKIIENFMIAANTTVAEHMRALDYPLVYRNHGNPKPERIDGFVGFMEGFGYTFKGTRHNIHLKQLCECLESFKGTDQYDLISHQLLRTMAKAKYETVSIGHYGLGLENYCHFTSPIRRYPDLVVHRCLKKYVFETNFSQMDDDHRKHEKICTIVNKREKLAAMVEQDVTDLRMCQYMEDHMGQVYEGVISSIQSFGMFVKLKNGVEGLVHVSNMGGYFELTDAGTLKSNTEEYHLLQTVRVKCLEVNKLRRDIDFMLI